MLAKDGKPYDIDEVGSLASNEVEIIQYLRPSGKRRRMAAGLGIDWAKKAKDLIISAEELSTGKIALYVRKIGQQSKEEKMGIVDNGPGSNSPDKVLKKLISEILKSTTPP